MTAVEEQQRTAVQAPAIPDGPNRRSAPRFVYLDWLRGAAAIIMMVGHTFHSFAADRQGSWYILSQFFGGMAPACFL
ncbi:MAG: hypothetical protein ABI823_10375, partial [Bryobacteraceae bacterium]